MPRFEQLIRVALAGLSPVLVAATDPEGPRGPGKPEPSAVVEVTAPLPVEPLVTTLDPKAPRQPLPAQDGAEALKIIPGFSVIRKGGTDGDPVFRGMAGSRLTMLLDGEHLMGGCGARMDPPTAYLFPEAYDQIIVTKGPQTVLYGPGSSAAVVRFERTHPSPLESGFRGSASLMAGSFGRRDTLLDMQAKTSQFYVRGTGTKSQSDDYRDGAGHEVHAWYQRHSGNAAVGWTPDEDAWLEVSGALSNGEAAYADRSVDGAKFKRENLGLKGELSRISSLIEKIQFQAYRNYIDHIMDNYSLRIFVPSMMSPEPSAMNPDRTTSGGRISTDLRISPATQATLGLDAQLDVHTGRMSMKQWTSPEELMPRVPDARYRSLGSFVEIQQAISGTARFNMGLRLDHWTAEDPRVAIATSMMSSTVNPTANEKRRDSLQSGFLRYTWDTPSGATYYAGIGQAQRFPDYWEAFTKESLASVSAFHTRPETTRQLDFGWVKRAGELRTSVSAFYGKTSDFILIQSNVAKPSGMMGSRLATVTRNVDATTWGGEVALEARPWERFRVDASLALTHGENTSDHQPLAQVPPVEGRLGLIYDAGSWSVGTLVRGVQRQDRFALNQGNIVGQDLGPTGGFTVLSINVGWKPATGWLITGGVDNLLNKTFAEHVSRGSVAVPGFVTQSIRVNEVGRNLWLKASYRFGA